ncbi:sulfite oxidase [Danaus plexippus]|uniref:sulfite oxidase n=1 Tax=Danaus plexippus TaxID=13037 RepID=UPI002AB17CDE|nr:sulfite oxidase [Danaus plexippus]
MSLRTILIRNLFRQKKVFHLTPCIIQSQKQYEDRYSNRSWKNENISVGLLASLILGTQLTENNDNENKQNESEPHQQAGAKRPDLPTYRAEEVSQHNNERSFWVTYKQGVYDVTSFLPSHPGGEQIYNAAGLSVEPFWNVYGMHKTKEIYELLESYRIGNLHEDDLVDHSDDEMWAKEPFRDKRLCVKTARPFNAETPPAEQVRHFDTPAELFYVRQHMPVPDLDGSCHRLTVLVEGEGERRLQLSVDELNRFKRQEVRAALMCAGNRRSEMNLVKPVKGLSWRTGAIGNAVWGGVLLRDVLLAAGVSDKDTEGKHVTLMGADMDATGTYFSTSIPLSHALDERARVLLATSMNGAPLTKDHGHPLRVVVPGAPAVRSVKWLQCIKVSSEESPSHWHQRDYRSFGPSVSWETADFPSAPPVYSLPVTSAVCSPEDGDTVRPRRGALHVQGYAYSGGGAKIIRVEVSTDRGATWREARLRSDSAPPREHYSWTLWDVDLPAAGPQMEIWVKATDSNFNAQPENFRDIWNIRGIISNAYHKIKVNVEQ